MPQTYLTNVAHTLYRSGGFVDIKPYPAREIPDEYKAYWVFLEKAGKKISPMNGSHL